MFLIIISIVALGIFLFSLDLSWTNLISAQRNALVFEGRHTEYGAFALRKEHHMNLFYALLLSVGLIGGGFWAVSALRSKPVQIAVPPQFEITIPVYPDVPVKKDKQVVSSTRTPLASGQPGQRIEFVSALPALPAVDPFAGAPGAGGTDPVGIEDPVDPGIGQGPIILEEPEKKKPKRIVRNMPEFPGGNNALMEFMHSRVRYTDFEVEKNVEGTIYISFTVNANGSVSDIIIERSIRDGDRLAKRATRAIEEMPTWTPGNDGAEPLSVIMTMPLKFELRN